MSCINIAFIYFFFLFTCINVGPTTPIFGGINPSRVLIQVDAQLGLITLVSSFMRTTYVILSSYATSAISLTASVNVPPVTFMILAKQNR